jgi:aminoglycoside phosphotransferase (APT) family kinase protein
LLAVLSQQITITAIPRYEFWDAAKGSGGYREIRGHNLSRIVVERLSVDEQERLAWDCAKVLSEIHSCAIDRVPIELACGEAKELLRIADLKRLLALEQPYSREECAVILDACTHMSEFLVGKRYEKVILHGDLHCDNVIFDDRSKRLAGLIDFSDAIVGPAIFDLVGFYRASTSLAENVQRHYAAIMGLDAEQLLADCRALALVKYGRDALCNRHATEPHGIRRLARSGYVMRSLLD